MPKKPPQSKSKNRNTGPAAKATNVRKRAASVTVSEGGGGEQGSGKAHRADTARATPAKQSASVRQSDTSPTTEPKAKRPPGRPPGPRLQPQPDDVDQPYGDPSHEPHGPPFSPEDYLAVLRRFADGMPLRQVCRIEGYPSYQRVYKKAHEDEEFGRRFACAREEFEDAIFDEQLEIADDSSQDRKVVMTKNGPVEVLDAEHISRSRLRCDVRQRWLEVRNNRKFGQKLQVDATHTFTRKVFRKGGGE